jgi:hypothetical protein
MAKQGEIVGAPKAQPSPNYNHNFGYNFGRLGTGKTVAVAYVIRANRRGRITMAGFMPNPPSGVILYGFVGKVSGEALVIPNGITRIEYENDSSPDAGTTALTPDLGLGNVLDKLFGDGSNTGLTVEGTGGNGAVTITLPVVTLLVGGPMMGPRVGKDAVHVEANDILAMVVITSSPGVGLVQGQIDAPAYRED